MYLFLPFSRSHFKSFNEEMKNYNKKFTRKEKDGYLVYLNRKTPSKIKLSCSSDLKLLS